MKTVFAEKQWSVPFSSAAPSDSAWGGAMLRYALAGAAYWLLLRADVHLADLSQGVHVVCPVTGLGFALLWIFGAPMLPVLFLAEFASAISQYQYAPGVGVAVTNVVAMYAGVAIVKYFQAPEKLYTSTRNVMLFVFGGCVVLSVLSMLGGVGVLVMSGAISLQSAFSEWVNWVLRAYTGCIIAAPLVIAWLELDLAHFGKTRPVESAVFILGMSVVGGLVFGQKYSAMYAYYPLAFVFAPFLIWAAFRLGRRETLFVIFLNGCIAFFSTVHGAGPFGMLEFSESIVLMQLYLAVMTATTLVLSAVVSERHVAMAKVKKAQDMTILSLVALAKPRIMENEGHLLRTQYFLKALAGELVRHPAYKKRLNSEQIDLMFKSAPLHDIGKVGVSQDILRKLDRLSPEEFEEAQRHVKYGREALGGFSNRLGRNSFLSMADEIIESHHERWDGRGYPKGLKGVEIPLSGRLMAVADAYDRVLYYGGSHCSGEGEREAGVTEQSISRAKDTIIQGGRTQFDPDIVKAFMQCEKELLEIARQYPDT